MPPMSQISPSSPSSRARPLRVGFLALTDAAPLAAAEHLGLFAKHGLKVELHREIGWATIREKIIYGELDAAHAPAPMLWSTHLGLGCPPVEVLTALVLNLHGNALTLSKTLWEAGARDADTLRAYARERRARQPLTFGVVFHYSSHHALLREWLLAAGLNPERDVRIVVVPPAQMFRNLAAGTIDGYCVGDPYNSQAVREKTGWIAATSAGLAPGHPEKIFMVRQDFAVARPEEHLALVAALQEAAVLCDDPAFRPELVGLLARPEYLNVPARTLAPGLVGPLDPGAGRASVSAENYIRFSRDEANLPAPLRAQWIIDGLVRHGLVPKGVALPPDLARRVFRPDLFSQARARHAEPVPAA